MQCGVVPSAVDAADHFADTVSFLLFPGLLFSFSHFLRGHRSPAFSVKKLLLFNVESPEIAKDAIAINFIKRVEFFFCESSLLF